jgi:hypothetical protein
MLTSMDSSEWTVERHLRDKPAAVVDLYRRFVELVDSCGPFDYAVSKTAITFKGSRRGFAGAKPTSGTLDGYLDLRRMPLGSQELRYLNQPTQTFRLPVASYSDGLRREELDPTDHR